MKVGEYRIYWSYGSKEKEVPMGNGKVTYENPIVECFIKKEDALMASGIAVCSIKDMFCRDKGRRISLARVLEVVKVVFPEVFHRKFRAEIWEAYRTMTAKPRWRLKESKSTVKVTKE